MEELIMQSLGAAGGGATLIVLLVFLGRNWLLARLSNSIKHEYNKALKDHEADLRITTESALAGVNARFDMELEMAKLRLGPYSEHQFKVYNDLWSHLCALRRSMKILWQVSLTPETFDDFAAKLDAASAKLEESALLIEPGHYEELRSILSIFMSYKMGKQSLLDYWRKRAADELGDAESLHALIEHNREARDRLEEYLPQMRLCLQSQLRARSTDG